MIILRVAAAIFIAVIPAFTLSRPSAPQGAIELANTSRYLGNDLWTWTVFVKAPEAALLDIQYVEYTLHPSFVVPFERVNKTQDPQYPFGLTRTGWGTFEIQARVFFKNGNPITLKHMLEFENPLRCGATFVLKERHFYKVPEDEFGGRLIVYVGTIHHSAKLPAFHLTVLTNAQEGMWIKSGEMKEPDFATRITNVPETERWSTDLSRKGDSMVFRINSILYRLDVLDMKPLGGNESITAHICEK